MGQSLIQNYIHLVFSSKGVKPLIKPSIEKDLHAYIGGICNELNCQPLIVGGYTDHIHVLCMLSKNITLKTLVQKIKANSSKWVKSKDEDLKLFSWQKGYGSFSINPSQTKIVVEYIKNQHEHHKKKTFKEEYLAFLKKYNVEYDEKYLWD
ncbi:MAG TPA: transposase [Brumimicrobium sp.]|nr:transposase [Brumimicrobium sp.]